MVNSLDICNLHYFNIYNWIMERGMFVQYSICLSVIPLPKYPTELWNIFTNKKPRAIEHICTRNYFKPSTCMNLILTSTLCGGPLLFHFAKKRIEFINLAMRIVSDKLSWKPGILASDSWALHPHRMQADEEPHPPLPGNAPIWNSCFWKFCSVLLQIFLL